MACGMSICARIDSIRLAFYRSEEFCRGPRRYRFRLGLQFFSPVLDTKGDRVLEAGYAKIRLSRGTKFARVRRFALPENAKNLNSTHAPAQTPNRETGACLAHIGI